jgi:hypothetical protein
MPVLIALLLAQAAPACGRTVVLHQDDVVLAAGYGGPISPERR